MSDSDIYKNRYQRERIARKEAEQLLEQKSLELYEANLALAELNQDLEKQVAKRTNQLFEAKEELEMIAYIASHDLKTPLRSIAHVSSWLEEDIQAGDYSEVFNYTALLKKRISRIEALLNSLVEYTSISQEILSNKEVNTRAMVEQIVMAESEGISVEVKINPDLPTLNTSKKLLHKVFKNLIHNAITYNAKNEKIVTIDFEKRIDSILFTVSDNGDGIDSRFTDKVFELFQTLNRKDEVETSGTGLSVAKKIVSSQGGEIWFKSKPEIGTTFYFTWKTF